MNSLGELYYYGKGVIQDYGKAREWYQKAADAGNTHAMNELGLLYAKGLGGAQDYGRRFHLIERYGTGFREAPTSAPRSCTEETTAAQSSRSVERSAALRLCGESVSGLFPG